MINVHGGCVTLQPLYDVFLIFLFDFVCLLKDKQIGQTDNNDLKVVISIDVFKYLVKILTDNKFAQWDDKDLFNIANMHMLQFGLHIIISLSMIAGFQQGDNLKHINKKLTDRTNRFPHRLIPINKVLQQLAQIEHLILLLLYALIELFGAFL